MAKSLRRTHSGLLGGAFILTFILLSPQTTLAQLSTDPENYYAIRYVLFASLKAVFSGTPEIKHQETYRTNYNFPSRYGFGLLNGSTTTGIGRVYHLREGGGRTFEHNLYPLDGIVVTPEYSWTKPGQYEIDFYTTQPDLINVDEYLTTLEFDLEFRDGVPPTCSLNVDPDTVSEPGTPTTLSWSTENAAAMTISEGVGAVATTSGSLILSPLITTTYRATSTNAAGTTATCSATVEVAEPEELHLQAALLAKQLVNTPDGYLWGGKGWDYDLGEYTTPERIKSGYAHVNQAGIKQTSVGLDCSGLITWAYNRSNNPAAKLTNSYVQYQNADGLFRDHQSDPVTESDLRPGDTLSFDWDGNESIDHVAMYVGESGGYDVVDALSERFGIVQNSKDSYILDKAFTDFRRIHQANSSLAVSTGSPVDLSVTDPDGNTLDASTIIYSDEEYIREIPGEMYYIEMEQGHDGRPKDQIISPIVKEGEYNIKVVPEPDAGPDATYSLAVEINGEVISVVENQLVSSVPEAGYSLLIEEGKVPTVAPKTIALLDELQLLVQSFPESTSKRQSGLLRNIESAKDWFVKERTDQVERKVLKVQTDAERHISELISEEELSSLQTLVTRITQAISL